MTTARAPRVAIVGVRRVRTGLGQFFAKHLVAAGAEVPAFIASRKETIEEGRWALRNVGIDAEGFVDLDALLDAHPVDALVIASPHESHQRWLEAAVSRGLHVLCEKPLVWGGSSPAGEAARLLELAAIREVVLFENCPWPYALPAFDELHPTPRREGMWSLEMEMAPSSTEPRAMLVDAMSHPLSVLQEFALRDEGMTYRCAHDPIEGLLEVWLSFQCVGFDDPIQARVRLRSVPTQPRPMAIVINGLRAERRIRMEDYSLSFTDGVRSVPLPDPMAALVADFVRTVRHGEPPKAAKLRMNRIAARLAMLEEIVGSFPGP